MIPDRLLTVPRRTAAAIPVGCHGPLLSLTRAAAGYQT